MYRPILALLLATACNSDPAAWVIMKPEPSEPVPPSDAGAPAPREPVAAPHAPEPGLPASQPPTQEAPPESKGDLQPNGCFPDYRDLGACCAPPIDPGDCDCRTGHRCARSCKYDSNGVANVAVFCVDGGVP